MYTFDHLWNNMDFYKIEGNEGEFRKLLKDFTDDLPGSFASWNLEEVAKVGVRRNDEIRVESLWRQGMEMKS